MFLQTIEQEIEEDERRIEACDRLRNRIENKLTGWRFVLRPFYQKAIERIKKEYDACCQESWNNTEYLMQRNCPVHKNCTCHRP
jgi:hypothetical protein